MAQKRQLSCCRAPCGPRLCSTTTEPAFISMLGIRCKLLINTWRKTLPLLSDAAATAQRLILDPAGSSPCCLGGQYHIFHLSWSCSSFLLSQQEQESGQKSSWVLFSLFLCPWPLGLFLLCFAGSLSKGTDDALEVDSLVCPPSGNSPIPWTSTVCPCGTHSPPLLPLVGTNLFKHL